MSAALSPEITQAFQPIFGRPAWQVKKGYGSFLTLEFGEPRLEIREPRSHGLLKNRDVNIRGDWHLWIYCCGWEIAQDGTLLAHSESDDATIAKATARLDGQVLERLQIPPGTVITEFAFDLGAILTTFPYNDSEEPDEQWMLYEPSGDVLCVRSDCRYSHGPGETPEDQMRWLPLF